MSELRADQLQKRFKSRTVVKDVSLDVKSGEVVGLLGPNGAGKTTCFYMIVGLIPSDGGSIYLDGMSLNRMPIHRRARMGLAYLPQEASIFRKLTVAENVEAVLELRGLTDGTKEEKLNDLLNDLHIGHLRNSPAVSLSGGERRRVEIARALASHPRFILLDEPFAGVDPIAVAEVKLLVQQLTQRGTFLFAPDQGSRGNRQVGGHTGGGRGMILADH